MNTPLRKALTILSVPLLAIPSAVGVYQFLEAHGDPIAAGMAAAGFEILYIGVNVLYLSAKLQNYARNVALSAVVVAILMNTLAHYGNAPAGDIGLMALSLIASAPLAALAYAVSVLLHKLSEEEHSMVTREQTLVLREQELTRQLADVASLEQVADKKVASADSYMHQCEQEIADQRARLAEREQQPIRIEQVETIKIATHELTWSDFEQVAKRLTADAPSVSSLRRIVASVKEE